MVSPKRKLLYPVALLITASQIDSAQEIKDIKHIRRALDRSRWTERSQHRNLRDRSGEGSNFDKDVSDGEKSVLEGFNLFVDGGDGENIYDVNLEGQAASGRVHSERLFESASYLFQTQQQPAEQCVLENGLYGDIAAGKLIYDIIYKYQTTLISGVDPQDVLPYIDTRVPQGILPALFPDCSNSERLQMTSSMTYFGISASAADIIAPNGLNCLKDDPTDCYVFEGYLTVSISQQASEDEATDFIRSEVQGLMQGTYLESGDARIVDVQYLNPDFTTVVPIPTSNPGGSSRPGTTSMIPTTSPISATPTGNTLTTAIPTEGAPIAEPTFPDSGPTPGRPTPGPSTPGRPTPGRPTSGRPTSDPLTPGPSTPGRPTPGRPTSGRPTADPLTPSPSTPGPPSPGPPTPGSPTSAPTTPGSPSLDQTINPTSDQVVTTLNSDDGLLQWWTWVLIGAGAAALMLLILLLLRRGGKEKSKPLSSSDLVSNKDVVNEYVPPGMENNQFSTSAPLAPAAILPSTPVAEPLSTVAESKAPGENHDDDEEEDDEMEDDNVEYEEAHEEDGEVENGEDAEDEYASSVDPEDEDGEEYEDHENEHEFEEESYYEEETIHNDSDHDETNATPKR